jgi:hypothetical protein
MRLCTVAAPAAAAALALLAGCYGVTRRDPDGDADADGDGDGGILCDEDLPCEGAGIELDYPISIDAEVVEVDGDRAVLIGADGLPVTFVTCGPGLAAALATGDAVRALHFRPEGWGDCWLSLLEAEGAVAPPLTEIGWTSRLLPACSGTADRVCNGSAGPTHLDVPATVHDVELTTETGARGTLSLGETAAVGDWVVSLVAASSSDAVDQGGCFVAAEGRSLLGAVRQAGRSPCPEPPEADRSRLGLSVSAAETSRDLRVVDVQEDLVVLVSDEGVEITFGWYGPDPRRSLAPGQMVTARRYPPDVTGSGLLDVLLADGVPVLAAIASDDFVIAVPDLSVIGLDVALGEACALEDGVSECTGETLFAERYPVTVANDRGASVTVEVGETELLGALLVTLLEASQHPGVVCPDFHVEAWGPFGLTVMQEYL